MLSGATATVDEDGADLYAPDNVTTAAHSSPISTVRTPPDFSAAVHMQHHQHQFVKQLDGVGADAACFDPEEAYHSGFGMAQDPFGLDASLFSI